MATENKYKKGDWVRAKDAYVAEHWNAYWANESGVTAGRDTVFKVWDGYTDDDTITIGAGAIPRGPTWSASRFEPWQPKVGERVRYVASYGTKAAGKEAVVLMISDYGGIRVRLAETGAVHTESPSSLEPITDTLPVAEQPAARGMVANSNISATVDAINDEYGPVLREVYGDRDNDTTLLTVTIDAEQVHDELDAIIAKLKKIRKLRRELGLVVA